MTPPHLYRGLFLLCLALILVPGGPVCLAEPGPADHVRIVGFERFYTGEDADPQQGGELLLGELGCTNCHQPDDAARQRLLTRRAPRLENVSSRLRPEYLRRFITDPHGTDPGTPMPDLFAGAGPQHQDEIVEALTHYLASLKRDDGRTDPQPRNGDAERGRHLYHTVGCVACHAPDPEYRPESTDSPTKARHPDVPSVPLNDLDRKYRPGALAAFLEDPLSVRPAARMPHVPLSEQEATNLAAYLREGPFNGSSSDREPSDSEDFEPTPKLVRRGRDLFGKLGCAACHRSDEQGSLPRATLQAPKLAALSRRPGGGCLAPDPQRGTPHYRFSEPQRKALRAALSGLNNAAETGRSEDTATAPDQLVRRSMTALNCYACHQRDKRGGPGSVRAAYFRTTADQDLGREGRFPPPLTYAGAKLQPEALRRILRGNGAVRPYMATRMPGFGAEHADRLADLLPKADLTDEFVTGARLRGRTHWGRKLMGVNGLGCITCHKLNGHDALGIPGLDLATVPDRLRRAWFDQYLREPARFRPGTRMPSFWPDGEPTNREIGFGSGAARTRRQINSIWVYLSSLDQNPLPEGLADSDQFVLRPTEEGEPIVVRAFMKNVGMHAIAIGYPEEIHTAFDAKRMRFALAWRGRFLDAEGVWWKRRVEMLEPLGEDVIALSSGAPFARLPDSKASWPEAEDHRSDYRFDGYRLDQNGVPTFLYRYQDIQIADRLVPNASSDGFRRIIELSDTEASGEARKTLWFRAAAGESVRRASDRRWVVDDRRTIHWTAPGEAHPRILDENGRAELRVPVEFDGKGTARIEMELTW